MIRKWIYKWSMLLRATKAREQTKSAPSQPVIPYSSIYNFKMRAIDGREIDFSSFKGKKLLIVNTASECGYTPQYAELQALHEQYGNKVTLLGFPANNFGGQEPGTNEQIGVFCERNYGVSFQLFEKIDVTGAHQHPLYRWLSHSQLNGWNDSSPNWNFCKYLVSEKGELMKFYPSAISPLDEGLLKMLD